jgi:hypothetical protein
MPAQIDATKGGQNSNSYITLEEADQYFDNMLFFDEWDSLEVEDKLRFIHTAMEMLENLQVKFDKADPTQALKFPVSTLESKDDGWDAIRKALKAQLKHLVFHHQAIRDAENFKVSGMLSESVSKSYQKFAGFNELNKYPTEVRNILSYYVNFGVRIKRA